MTLNGHFALCLRHLPTAVSGKTLDWLQKSYIAKVTERIKLVFFEALAIPSAYLYKV